jgi:hypothetical protein
MEHDPYFRETVHAIDHGLRSARTILLTINIVCAFLFLAVFELVLGWQSFRPGASRYIFAESLAVLATTPMTTPLSSYELEIVKLARLRCCTILDNQVDMQCTSALNLDDSTGMRLRDKLIKKLNTSAVWVEEEQLRSFIVDVELMGTYLDEKASAAVAALEAKRLEITLPLTSNNTIATGRPVDDICGSGRVGLDPASARDTAVEKEVVHKRQLGFTSNRISYHLQEIIDRDQVNDETKGRRVSRREFPFPVIGAVMQLEDISLPIAIFLLLLTYWLYTSLMRAYDPAMLYLDYCRRESAKPRDSSEKDVSICRQQFELMINRFQFFRVIVRSNGAEVDAKAKLVLYLGILWLFMAPYLVIMSSVLANFHETFILDVRYHGSTFAHKSSTVTAFWTISAVVGACAVFLAWIARKARNGFLNLFDAFSTAWNKMPPIEKPTAASEAEAVQKPLERIAALIPLKISVDAFFTTISLVKLQRSSIFWFLDCMPRGHFSFFKGTTFNPSVTYT